MDRDEIIFNLDNNINYMINKNEITYAEHLELLVFLSKTIKTSKDSDILNYVEYLYFETCKKFGTIENLESKLRKIKLQKINSK